MGDESEAKLNKLIKVCHLTSVHGPEDARIFEKEAKTLVKAGYLVTLLGPWSERSWKADGIKLRGFSKPRNRFKRLLAGGKVLKLALAEQARIYHFHDPELIFVGLALKFLGKKVIYDAHEDLPKQVLAKTWIHRSLRKLVAFAARLVEKAAAVCLDAVISATPAINARFYKTARRAVNINNFPKFTNLKEEPMDVPTACYLGGITRVRGIFEMVEGCRLAGVKLILAGEFQPPALREELAGLSSWRNVEDLGMLNRKGVLEVLARARIGLAVLHPLENYLESLPVKLFEYMAAGIPVIASDFPLWKKIVEDNGCGLCVKPQDPTALAEAIRWLLEHPEEAGEMGKRGRRAVQGLYNWEREGEKLLNLYRELADE